MGSPRQDIAFIGLGAMGFGMATNLVKQGYRVTGFDVWGPTLERFRAAGGETEATPAKVVAGKGFIVSCVANSQQTQAVFFDGEGAALPAIAQGATLLIASTVACSYIQSFQQQLVDAGRGDILLVDCPISGGIHRAADGTLSIMAGGSDEAIDSARFLLQEMADEKKLYIVKGGIGAGSNMKMVHQVLAAVQILSASEAMGFATHLGLDLKVTREAVLQSEGRSFMFDHRTPRMLSNFQPLASALTIILKDVGIVTSEARRCEFPTPMSTVAEQVYFSALGRGYGPDDDSSLLRLYAEGKGAIGPVAGTASTDEAKLALVNGLLKGIHLCAAAETLAFAARLGLELGQVFDLCINAAGGSYMLEAVGPEIMDLLGASPATGPTSGNSISGDLQDVAGQLHAAVDEAQRLKLPLYLGTQALTLVRLALSHRPKGIPGVATAGQLVKVWGAAGQPA